MIPFGDIKSWSPNGPPMWTSRSPGPFIGRLGRLLILHSQHILHEKDHWPCDFALHWLYPPNNEVVGGVYWFHSVRPSRLPCPLCNIYSSGWILSILAINDHYHERVCRTQWPWPISSRSFGVDLENRVRSVASTVLDRFFLYLAQMITIIRGCVACYVLFRNWKFEFFANF